MWQQERGSRLLGARLQMPRKRSLKDKRTKNDSRTTEEWMQSLVFEWAKVGYKGP
jgi:hypothetical protein